MNLETIDAQLRLFNREVIESGFRRDVQDYMNSLPASQNNIVALREIADDVATKIRRIRESDLDDGLRMIFPGKVRPFTEPEPAVRLEELLADKEVVQDAFFSRLQGILNRLNSDLEANVNEVERIRVFLRPFLTTERELVAEEGNALASLIFSDPTVTASLKSLTRTLNTWGQVLPIYHGLLKSESPSEIAVESIRDGSLDVILSLDVKVAIDLVDVFKAAFDALSGYLMYKAVKAAIVERQRSNEKLLKHEEKSEQILLDGIGEVVTEIIKGQHDAAREADSGVDHVAHLKRIEVVAKAVTAHVVRGNDYKVLALPTPTEGEDAEATEDVTETQESYREVASQARHQLRRMPEEKRLLLASTYPQPKVEDAEAAGGES